MSEIRCMCNCFECELQTEHEARVACAAFMSVRIAADNKKQLDQLLNRLNADKKGKAIIDPHKSKPAIVDGQGMEPM